MTAETLMPDGSPMHRPCTCPECGPGPGISFTTESFLKILEAERAARRERLERQRRLLEQENS